jgi:predicted  nucleic acid-binding Zn-ribbon protein
MHYLIPKLNKQIAQADKEIQEIEKQMTMLFPEHPKFIILQQSIESLQDDIAGWEEQIGDLQAEDRCGINYGYQL